MLSYLTLMVTLAMCDNYLSEKCMPWMQSQVFYIIKFVYKLIPSVFINIIPNYKLHI